MLRLCNKKSQTKKNGQMDMGVFNLRELQTKDRLSIIFFRIKYFHWVLEFHFFTASKLCFKTTCTKA